MAKITDLLQRARPKPSESDTGGATLALALHCLMVKNDFQVTPGSRNPYAPPPDWNSKYHDEWKFEYTRKGYENGFVLHCSLQAATGKMFVQGREERTGNIQILGLQVENYATKEEGKLSWDKMLTQEDLLEAMFKEYIVEQLINHAVESSKEENSTAYDWLQRATESLQQRDAFVVIGIVSTAAIVASIAYYVHRRRQK